MSNLTIISYPENPRVYKALIAAKYVGVEIDVPAFEFGKHNRTVEFLAKNPFGKVPVLDTPTGAIFESNAIMRYVARLKDVGLYGKNDVEAGQIDQWIDVVTNEVEPNAVAWLAPIFGYLPYVAKNTERAAENLRSVLTVLNRHLALRTFFVGHRVTLADIAVACGLYSLYKCVFDATFRAPFTHVNRWFLTCVNQPEFKAVVGDFVLCEVAQQAAKPEKKESEKPKKEAAPKKEAEKPKKEAAPKKEEPKKEAEKPKKEVEEDDGDDVPRETKKRSALDDLPPSKLVLDAWKRQYSNSDTRTGAIPWLWENYDAAGYCWYRCSYKYPDELGALFQTCNLIGGLLQRCEELRKYAFGSILIHGESNKHAISGVWLFRGHGIPAEMKDVPDYESYDFSPLDPSKDEDRELINDYLAWDKPINGQAVLDGKNFK